MTKGNPIKKAGALVGIIFSIIVLLAGYFVFTHFWVYQVRVDGLLRSLPREEADPAPAVRDVIRRADQEGLRIWLPKILAAEFKATPMRMAEWHAHSFVWSVLLPLRLSEDQRISLYCHFLSFEKGRGLSHGAEYYFSKKPDNLSTDEVLGLIAISRSPSRYSPKLYPEDFRKEVERLKHKYGAV